MHTHTHMHTHAHTLTLTLMHAHTCTHMHTHTHHIPDQVAAVSGDARRALDICRRATELAAQDHQSSGRGRTSSSAAVNTSHINRAVQEMFSSPKIVAIR